MSAPKVTVHKTQFIRVIGVLVAVGLLGSFIVYQTSVEANKGSVLRVAKIISSTLDAKDIEQLSGGPSDLGTPAYEKLKANLARTRSLDTDIRFVYVFGKNSTKEIFFYADSEDSSSPDYSPPGQIYHEATPDMKTIFDDKVARSEGPDRDRWGTWFTGMSPILDSKGKVVAVVGVDVPANDYVSAALSSASIPLTGALIIIIVLVGYFGRSLKTEPKKQIL